MEPLPFIVMNSFGRSGLGGEPGEDGGRGGYMEGEEEEEESGFVEETYGRLRPCKLCLLSNKLVEGGCRLF